jgi:Domain of unknown function (DUF4278)
MKLQYRGITYQQQIHQLETIDLGINCKFLGQTYPWCRSHFLPHTDILQSGIGIRKYRGVSYGNNTQKDVTALKLRDRTLA